jgi:hypothetical protein
VPVTPVVSGNPVAFVSTKADGDERSVGAGVGDGLTPGVGAVVGIGVGKGYWAEGDPEQQTRSLGCSGHGRCCQGKKSGDTSSIRAFRG